MCFCSCVVHGLYQVARGRCRSPQEEAQVCESAALTLMEERSASKLNQEKLDLMQQQLDQMNQLTEDNQAMLHQREQELLVCPRIHVQVVMHNFIGALP